MLDLCLPFVLANRYAREKAWVVFLGICKQSTTVHLCGHTLHVVSSVTVAWVQTSHALYLPAAHGPSPSVYGVVVLLLPLSLQTEAVLWLAANY